MAHITRGAGTGGADYDGLPVGARWHDSTLPRPTRTAPCSTTPRTTPPSATSLNPSWLVAQALDGQRIAGHRVVAAQLPTVFGDSMQQLRALATAHRPALTI
eukprot:gene7102-9045_t